MLASSPSSDPKASNSKAGGSQTPEPETTDPRRPSDHFASPVGEVTNPRLGFVGYARFFWRQLTSMRTALFLLLLVAFAAVPGSLVPQRTADPDGVGLYE